jgi:hypothetical protein
MSSSWEWDLQSTESMVVTRRIKPSRNSPKIPPDSSRGILQSPSCWLSSAYHQHYRLWCSNGEAKETNEEQKVCFVLAQHSEDVPTDPPLLMGTLRLQVDLWAVRRRKRQHLMVIWPVSWFRCFHKWGYCKIPLEWMVYHGKSPARMDDDN